MNKKKGLLLGLVLIQIIGFIIPTYASDLSAAAVEDEDTVPISYFNQKRSDWDFAPNTLANTNLLKLSLKDKQHLSRYAFSLLDAFFGAPRTIEKRKINLDYDMLFVTLYHRHQLRGCYGIY